VVLTGVIAPDAGTIRLGGEVVAFASPQEAEAAVAQSGGMSGVAQNRRSPTISGKR